MLSKLQKLGPALDQVKVWQHAVDPAIDELRQIGSLFPQLMVQIRDSAGQNHKFSQQQQRFEVALLDLHSELQCLKSYLCCAADHLVLCMECRAAWQRAAVRWLNTRSPTSLVC